jgi:hypothetical protein
MIEFRGRCIVKGNAKGEALVTKDPISFYGGIDPQTGNLVERGHELEGKCIANKILIFPRGKGSTVGSYIIFRLKKNGRAPKAIVNIEAEPIVAVGAIISEIPMIDKVDEKSLRIIKSGDEVEVDAERGILRCFK